eukprot:GEMP01006922.1.p1 GENE.GEMP01006922.1~~GEMP01006922.1.p1  ORF type:complete len:613 (+),score=166.20 GEMP01006922.1:1003-2841(+)
MCDTMLMRQIRDATRIFKHELDQIKKDGPEGRFDKALDAAIKKAYGTTNPREQTDILSGQPVFGKVKQVYSTLEEWKKPYMAHAVELLVQLEPNKSSIVAKLSEVVDRALHCRQVQIKSFNLVISHSYRLVLSLSDHLNTDKNVKAAKKKRIVKTNDLEDYDTALVRFYECMEDYVDDHKENAFKSSFMEPARLYYFIASNTTAYDNVDTHGVNWYVSFLNSTLNVHLPILAAYWDTWPNATTDFWVGLNGKAWEEFSADNHFGMQFQGIGPFKKDKESLKSAFVQDISVQNASWPRGNGDVNPAKHFANEAVNPNNKIQKKLAVYAERFAHFFDREYFVKKAFNKLNSEEKPEHAGFRKACETLYAKYRVEQAAAFPAAYFDKKELPAGTLEDTLIEHAFHDDMYIEFAVENIDRFFVWLGVMKPSASSFIPAAENIVHAAEEAMEEEVPPLINEISTSMRNFHEAANAGDGAGVVRALQEQQTLSQQLREQEEADAQQSSALAGDAPALPEADSLEEHITRLTQLLQDAMRARNASEIRSVMTERDRVMKLFRERAAAASADSTRLPPNVHMLEADEASVPSLQELAEKTAHFCWQNKNVVHCFKRQFFV